MELKQDKADLRKERDQEQERWKLLQDERENLVNIRGELKAQLASQAEREAAALRRAEQAEQEKKDAIERTTELGNRAVEAEANARQIQAQFDTLMERVSVVDLKKPVRKQGRKTGDS